MCEPATLTMISIGLTAATGLYGADQQRKAGRHEQEVAEQNARLDRLRQDQAREAGNSQEEQQRARVRQVLASQRAAFAAQGIDASTGSPLDILGDTAGAGYGDALTMRSNALREAWGFGVSATNEVNRGRAARRSGNSQAVGTLLSSAASAAGQWGSAGFGGNRARPAASTSASAGRQPGPYRSGYVFPGGG
jgi:hypothetical protein